MGCSGFIADVELKRVCQEACAKDHRCTKLVLMVDSFDSGGCCSFKAVGVRASAVRFRQHFCIMQSARKQSHRLYEGSHIFGTSPREAAKCLSILAT